MLTGHLLPRVLFVFVYALFSTIFLLSVIALFTVRNEIQKRKNEIKIGVVNGKRRIVGSVRFGKDSLHSLHILPLERLGHFVQERGLGDRQSHLVSLVIKSHDQMRTQCPAQFDCIMRTLNYHRKNTSKYTI